ncbi:MAG: hypothetical protein WA715_19305, partial [Candidatus Acidiferrum sp.]
MFLQACVNEPIISMSKLLRNVPDNVLIIFPVNTRLPVSVQTVDATSSGIKLFFEVVFMKQGRRFGFSAEQKLDVWRRWKAGQTLHEIGRAFGKEHSSIRCLVSRHGGVA